MVRKAEKFTPEVLIGSPRRSTGKPSNCGKYVLYSERSYDFKTHKRTSEIRVLECEKGLSHLIVGDSKASEAHWLPNNGILYLRPDEETGHVDLVKTSISAKDHKVIGSADGQISDLKLKPVKDGIILVLGWGKADHRGDLVNEKKVKAPAHTMRLYDSLMVRHWDTWKDKFHNALFLAQLNPSSDEQESWSLKGWLSVHKGTKLESPIPPFGGSDHFDISEHGVVFVTKDPDLSQGLHSKCNCYFVPLSMHKGMYVTADSGPREIETDGLFGAASSPVFSPDGKSVAFLKMKEDGYESDRNLIVITGDLVQVNAESPLRARTIAISSDDWDISPDTLVFGQDKNSLFLRAQFNGQQRAFLLDIPSKEIEPMSRTGSVQSMVPMQNPPRLFLSGSNLVDDSFYAILWPHKPRDLDIISSHSRNGELYGLDPSQSTSFWYKGDKTTVHAFMFLPPGFDWKDKSKKYPLAMLVHGGPQAAWLDEWSTRWNPAVWAAQGYVTIMPNITGSTSYGQAFVDAITNNWGGTPYLDLVALWKHIEEHMNFVDLDRAIAAGASYGGYMMNWIQGHDLGRKFKAIVCHDGVFDTYSGQMASEEIYFGIHDFNGVPWEHKELPKGWWEWNPARFIHNWATPQLLIHGERDYRLTIGESLGPFNALQGRGVPSKLLVGKTENHWVLNEENSLVWHTVVLNWANKYAGLPPYKKDEESVIELDEPFPGK